MSYIFDKVINGKSKVPWEVFGIEWAHEQSDALVSASTHGQWTQVRHKKAGHTEDMMCQLCHLEIGNAPHRKNCRCVKPEGGWPEVSCYRHAHWHMQHISSQESG